MSLKEILSDTETIITVDVHDRYDTGTKILTQAILKSNNNNAISAIKIDEIRNLRYVEKTAKQKLSIFTAFKSFSIAVDQVFVEIVFDIREGKLKPSLNLVFNYNVSQFARYPVKKIIHKGNEITSDDISKDIMSLMNKATEWSNAVTKENTTEEKKTLISKSKDTKTKRTKRQEEIGGTRENI